MTKRQAWAALSILTALNFVNYIDRSVLFAVQDLVRAEFLAHDPNANTKLGFLTTTFFIGYMVTAPIVGRLADRYQRRVIMAGGALLWSAATLLTALTYDFQMMLIRHTVIGVGEATFVTIAPAFISDMFPEQKRGRVLSFFYLAIPMGTALGYLVGGYFGHHYGWRAPFFIGSAPGVLMAVALMFIPEPERGQQDTLKETAERGTLRGLLHNKAFWTATLGMAMMTFAVGGMQVWMPTFLTRMRGVPMETANNYFGLITLVNGIAATLIGGWLGDRALRTRDGGYYWVSAIGLAIAMPAIVLAVTLPGLPMYAAIFVGEFFLLLNTAPLNAALVNSVGAHIRATAVAVNLFVIHILGDTFSPTMMGFIADKTNLRISFLVASLAVGVAVAILLYGMRFAPRLPEHEKLGIAQT